MYLKINSLNIQYGFIFSFGLSRTVSPTKTSRVNRGFFVLALGSVNPGEKQSAQATNREVRRERGICRIGAALNSLPQ